jgi:hypothetical protein
MAHFGSVYQMLTLSQNKEKTCEIGAEASNLRAGILWRFTKNLFE